MISILRKKLWETMYLNPVWPSELLENLKDPSYKDIKYRKVEKGCQVELTFLDDNTLVKAIYHFDENDYLQKAIMIENSYESIIFNREEEVARIMNEILSLTSKEAINELIA